MTNINMAIAAGAALLWYRSHATASTSKGKKKADPSTHKRSLQVVTTDPDLVRKLTAAQSDQADATVDSNTDNHRGLDASDSPTAQPDATIDANPSNARGLGTPTANLSSYDPGPQAAPLAAPKKPTPPPKMKKRPPPTAAKLSKPAKRTPKQAATDLKDYLDGGGNRGSRTSRSTYVASCQRDMGIPADGIYGAKTSSKAAQLGVMIEG